MTAFGWLAWLLAAFGRPGAEARLAPVAGWPAVPAGWSFTMVSNISGDSRGRIYVASRGDHPITIFEGDGRFAGTMGDADIRPSTNYDLTVSPPRPISVKRWVHGIFVDSTDNVWVTDLGRHVVMKFSPRGKLLLTLGTLDKPGESPTNFNQPSSVAVAPTGEVYVADGYGNSRVAKFASDGKFVRAWGKKGSGPGEFNTPHALALDGRGRVYVAERLNNRVSVFDSDGKFLAQWTGLDHADAIFIHNGRAYVGTGADKRLVRFDLDGRNAVDVAPPGNFGYTHGIYLDRAGDLYVADPIADDAHKPPTKFALSGR